MVTMTDQQVNDLIAYIEATFECQPCLVSNIVHYAAAQGLPWIETLDILEDLLDGLGITRWELMQYVNKDE